MICWEMYGSGVGIGMEITQMKLLSTLQDRMMLSTVFFVVAAGALVPGTCGLLSVVGPGPTTASTALASALPGVMKGKAGRGVAEQRERIAAEGGACGMKWTARSQEGAAVNYITPISTFGCSWIFLQKILKYNLNM